MQLAENTVLLRLEFGRLGNSREGDKEQIQVNAEKSRLRLSKVLFDCPEYAAIAKFDNELRAWVLQRAIQVDVGFRGVYVLPVSLLQNVEQHLTEAIAARDTVVMAFMETYNAQRKTARAELRDQFRESDYPDVGDAMRAFRLRWRYVTFEVPQNLPPEILERERAEREAAFADMTAQVREALRATLSGLLGHLSERLTPTADGQRKIFRDSVVSNLVEFLELFDSRNVTGDDELSKIAQRARQVVESATPEHLRDKGSNGESLRQSVASMSAALKTAVDNLIETEHRRRFNFDDDTPSVPESVATPAAAA